MEREALQSLVEQLGREFRRRNMHEHLRAARLYWLALRHRLLSGRLVLHVDWDAELAREWARLFGLPGHEPYPIRPRGSGCPCLPSGHGLPVDIATAMTLPWARKVRCRRCGNQWLELER